MLEQDSSDVNIRKAQEMMKNKLIVDLCEDGYEASRAMLKILWGEWSNR